MIEYIFVFIVVGFLGFLADLSNHALLKKFFLIFLIFAFLPMYYLRDYTIGTDYWAMLRNHIKYVLNHSGKAEELDVVLDRVSEDKRANYSQKIGGLKKFWKKRKIEFPIQQNLLMKMNLTI